MSEDEKMVTGVIAAGVIAMGVVGALIWAAIEDGKRR